MNFNKLPVATKQEIHKIMLADAMRFGGKNFFLQLIEEIKAAKPHPLLNKSCVFYYSKGKISWDKAIFKENLTLLFHAIEKEDKDGDILGGLEPKIYKLTLNMIKALKPISMVITPKDTQVSEVIELKLFDVVDENNVKINPLVKALFVYSIEFTKQALSYEIRELSTPN
jgi:hypothetical protein